MAIPHFTTLSLRDQELLVAGPVLDDPDLTGHVFHYAIMQGEVIHRGTQTTADGPTWNDLKAAPGLRRGNAHCLGVNVSFRETPFRHFEIFTWSEVKIVN